MSDLNPYEEGLAIDLATAQARIEELEAKLAKAVEESAEALNQLDSARHSVEVLEKRLAELTGGKKDG